MARKGPERSGNTGGAKGIDIGEVRGLAEWITLYQAYHGVFKVQELGLLPHNLSLPQLHVLGLLTYAGAELTTGEIGRAMVKASQTITGLVDRLEEPGLVERRFDRRDRRKTFIRITDAGRQRFAEAFPTASQVGAEVFGSLSDQQLAALRDAATTLRTATLDRLGVSLKGL